MGATILLILGGGFCSRIAVGRAIERRDLSYLFS